MTARDGGHEPGPDELGVLISAGAGEPERLVMLGRPSAGRVRVREWSTHNWSGAPDERDLPVEHAYTIFQRAFDARRRLSAALPEIRAWLEGHPL